MFPKTPDNEWWLISEWTVLDEEQKKEKLFSLGNATLLSSEQNITVSNKIWVWEKKKEEYGKNTCLQHEKNELNLLEKSVLLPKDIDDRKKWLIKEFRKSGILFIDEKREKVQTEEKLED
ncbi:GmrSD restriction endonuclease domain-containing protein [endosymbiont GvMRE of Glomus versiforme]|uniref:GmrSD restriction endonuclease domain-containing protein n=1 Tax=endosymbiont GvMRE of Glomus versiforme TaxID=2039283 RepID=UPI0011C39BAA